MIEDLLNVSRIEADQLSIEPDQLELGTLVREVVERLAAELARSCCPVSVHASGPVTGIWDRSRLDQVVTNLLSNAMKFGRGKPIAISVGAADGVARMTVTDAGIGVDPALQARIFDRFQRGVSADHYGGLGLGLYISRRMVEVHGGSIRVQSRPGAGATFTVELPTGRQDALARLPTGHEAMAEKRRSL